MSALRGPKRNLMDLMGISHLKIDAGGSDSTVEKLTLPSNENATKSQNNIQTEPHTANSDLKDAHIASLPRTFGGKFSLKHLASISNSSESKESPERLTCDVLGDTRCVQKTNQFNGHETNVSNQSPDSNNSGKTATSVNCINGNSNPSDNDRGRATLLSCRPQFNQVTNDAQKFKPIHENDMENRAREFRPRRQNVGSENISNEFVSNERSRGDTRSGTNGEEMGRENRFGATSAEGHKSAPVKYIPPELDESEVSLFERLEKGENFDKMNEYTVEVSGNNTCKHSLERFEDAKVSPTIMQNIKKAGYTSPTLIQKWSIPTILEGRDMMACAQTGSGKTAAFLVPVLSMLMNNDELLMKTSLESTPSPLVLILTPTRELAIQIHKEIRKFAYGTILKCACIYGGVDVHYQLSQLRRGHHMVVGTIGRINDFVKTGKMQLSNVHFLIIDEADRMLDLGFHDEVVSIASQCSSSDRQTLMFSATFPVDIQELAHTLLEDYVFVTVGLVGQANKDIKQIIWRVDHRKKRDKLVSLLEEIGSEKVIVFIQTKRMADILGISLGELLDLPITTIHGDLSQKEREEAMTFFRQGKASVLMATSVAARGLDILGVKHVINYDLPDNIDEYVHRIGRTARCGNTGRAVSFFVEPQDLKMARPLVKVLSDAQQNVPDWLEEFAASSSGGIVDRNDLFKTRDVRRNGKFQVRELQNNGMRGPCNLQPGEYNAPVVSLVDNDEEWL